MSFGFVFDGGDNCINNYEDKDLDADGMPDIYETKYGCVEGGSWECDPDSGIIDNVVNGGGWQNPWIHNARYAVLIGSVSKEQKILSV
ncbi:MAG: hypothetical protein AB1485_02970 [Candidatus Thermoplasmatota archaeon]